MATDFVKYLRSTTFHYQPAGDFVGLANLYLEKFSNRSTQRLQNASDTDTVEERVRASSRTERLAASNSSNTRQRKVKARQILEDYQNDIEWKRQERNSNKLRSFLESPDRIIYTADETTFFTTQNKDSPLQKAMKLDEIIASSIATNRLNRPVVLGLFEIPDLLVNENLKLLKTKLAVRNTESQEVALSLLNADYNYEAPWLVRLAAYYNARTEFLRAIDLTSLPYIGNICARMNIRPDQIKECGNTQLLIALLKQFRRSIFEGSPMLRYGSLAQGQFVRTPSTLQGLGPNDRNIFQLHSHGEAPWPSGCSRAQWLRQVFAPFVPIPINEQHEGSFASNNRNIQRAVDREGTYNPAHISSIQETLYDTRELPGRQRDVRTARKARLWSSALMYRMLYAEDLNTRPYYAEVGNPVPWLLSAGRVLYAALQPQLGRSQAPGDPKYHGLFPWMNDQFNGVTPTEFNKVGEDTLLLQASATNRVLSNGAYYNYAAYNFDESLVFLPFEPSAVSPQSAENYVSTAMDYATSGHFPQQMEGLIPGILDHIANGEVVNWNAIPGSDYRKDPYTLAEFNAQQANIWIKEFFSIDPHNLAFSPGLQLLRHLLETLSEMFEDLKDSISNADDIFGAGTDASRRNQAQGAFGGVTTSAGHRSRSIFSLWFFTMLTEDGGRGRAQLAATQHDLITYGFTHPAFVDWSNERSLGVPQLPSFSNWSEVRNNIANTLDEMFDWSGIENARAAANEEVGGAGGNGVENILGYGDFGNPDIENSSIMNFREVIYYQWLGRAKEVYGSVERPNIRDGYTLGHGYAWSNHTFNSYPLWEPRLEGNSRLTRSTLVENANGGYDSRSMGGDIWASYQSVYAGGRNREGRQVNHATLRTSQINSVRAIVSDSDFLDQVNHGFMQMMRAFMVKTHNIGSGMPDSSTSQEESELITEHATGHDFVSAACQVNRYGHLCQTSNIYVQVLPMLFFLGRKLFASGEINNMLSTLDLVLGGITANQWTSRDQVVEIFDGDGDNELPSDSASGADVEIRQAQASDRDQVVLDNNARPAEGVGENDRTLIRRDGREALWGKNDFVSIKIPPYSGRGALQLNKFRGMADQFQRWCKQMSNFIWNYYQEVQSEQATAEPGNSPQNNSTFAQYAHANVSEYLWFDHEWDHEQMGTSARIVRNNGFLYQATVTLSGVVNQMIDEDTWLVAFSSALKMYYENIVNARTQLGEIGASDILMPITGQQPTLTAIRENTRFNPEMIQTIAAEIANFNSLGLGSDGRKGVDPLVDDKRVDYLINTLQAISQESNNVLVVAIPAGMTELMESRPLRNPETQSVSRNFSRRVIDVYIGFNDVMTLSADSVLLKTQFIKNLRNAPNFERGAEREYSPTYFLFDEDSTLYPQRVIADSPVFMEYSPQSYNATLADTALRDFLDAYYDTNIRESAFPGDSTYFDIIKDFKFPIPRLELADKDSDLFLSQSLLNFDPQKRTLDDFPFLTTIPFAGSEVPALDPSLLDINDKQAIALFEYLSLFGNAQDNRTADLMFNKGLLFERIFCVPIPKEVTPKLYSEAGMAINDSEKRFNLDRINVWIELPTAGDDGT